MQTPIAKTPMNIAWDDLRLILALIRGQTLAGAAEQLHVDTSTVFRGVRAIEQRLQNPLFERSRKGYTPTALGERLAQTAERIEREMLELETQLSGCAAAPTGNLRVSTTDTVLYYHLLPALPQFTARYPQIHLELVASNQLVNLSRREVDMVIRATTTPPQHWIGRCLGKLPYAIHAAPDYWKHHQHLPLDEHLWLAPDDSFGEHPTIRWRRQHYPKVVPRYRFNSMYALSEAVAAGAGISVLPTLYATSHSRLLPISALIDDLPNALWILTHPDLRNLVRVRAFMEFCQEIFAPKLPES